MSQIAADDAVVVPSVDDNAAPRRPSIEKPPLLSPDSDYDYLDDDESQPSAFQRLPEEIIQQILESADPSSFASLILLNSEWRNASQQGHLYAIQLMRCPSYSASHKKCPDGKQENLPELRKLFAREVKRNLFDAYLRPNHTMIKLVSNSISSSSCPGGDGMSFSPSPKGHYLLAYNSSRIHILDLRGPTITVERELKILRRPVATCIKDDGSLLAVLLTEMQVDLYDLTCSPPKHVQSLILDHSPRAIALSPCGSVLAAAYEGGIEVQSLNPGALATDRRSVKCDAVDALAFSFDGTQILGTTLHSAQPNTVILTAPYYDPGAQMDHENISALWTTSILFPNTSRDCSHAVLIQESSHEEAYWTFTYDCSFETFRAVRIDDLRNGTTYFTGPISNTPSKLIPCTMPAASYGGELVSAGFRGKEVWLYGVPEDLDAVPDASNASLDANPNSDGVYRSVSGSSMRSRPRTQEAGDRRVPQWQLLCDKYRNTFVGGFKAAELTDVSTVKWVASYGDSSLKERLVIAAKGATPAKPISMDDDGMDFEDGGRLTLIDFDYGVEDGCVTELTIEVGMKEPEVLEEERRDLETEVAIVRRRTVAQRRGNRSAIMRAATTVARPTPAPRADESNNDDDPLLPRRITALAAAAAPVPARPASTATEETETAAVLEAAEALDAPYSHTGPRSITTLRRAATAAANHRRRNPTTSTGAPIEYRRADGRNELPHESDADNWVPPPPPYQKDDPGETPVFLRHSMVPVIPSDDKAPPVPPLPPIPPVPQTSQPALSVSRAPPSQQARSARRQTYMPDGSDPLRSTNLSHNRLSSYPTLPSTQISAGPVPGVAARLEEDDIYNVSPPDTPRPPEVASAEPRASEASDASHTVGSNPSPAPSDLPATPYTGTRRVIPLVPRIRTNTNSPQPSHILPEPSSAESTWNPHTGAVSSYVAAPAMHSQTWPMTAPEPVASTNVRMGYPRSAPPTSTTIEQMMQSHPPPPPPPLPMLEERPGSRGSGRASSLARRISMGFHLSRKRTASRSESRAEERTRPLSMAQPMPRPATTQRMYQQEPSRSPTPHGNSSLHRVQDYVQPIQDALTPAHNIRAIDYARSQPDQPLIISTPTGIQGAFDAPSSRHVDQQSLTPLVAPVPRYARPGQSVSSMRPAERLESMYYQQSHVQQLNSNFLTAPPAIPSDQTSSRLSPSVNRRPSRAERSAAKNIADAKKKGWRPGRTKSTKMKKNRPREPEFDIMSQSGWTDVTYDTATGGGRRRNNLPQGQQAGKAEKDKKCTVM